MRVVACCNCSKEPSISIGVGPLSTLSTIRDYWKLDRDQGFIATCSIFQLCYCFVSSEILCFGSLTFSLTKSVLINFNLLRKKVNSTRDKIIVQSLKINFY